MHFTVFGDIAVTDDRWILDLGDLDKEHSSRTS